jgi:hypothetical protein
MTPVTYCMVIGHAWFPGHAWRRANPSRPFAGLRVDPESRDVWVLCELAVSSKQLPVAAQEAVERAMERAAVESVCLAGVFIVRARNIGHGHRLTRAIVKVLEPHARCYGGSSGRSRRPSTGVPAQE